MVFRNRHCTKGSVSLDRVNTVWKRHGFNIYRFTLNRKRCVHKGHIAANVLQWWNKDVQKSISRRQDGKGKDKEQEGVTIFVKDWHLE